MNHFCTEPAYRHDQVAKLGVLLINLGTPAAPTAAALRPYLAEFLSDRRVVEIPPLVWKLILHGVILRVRPAKSAHKYASVWQKDGSPLAIYTQAQTNQLAARWQQRYGDGVVVRYAMRYGAPAVADVMAEMRAQGVTRFVVLPLYPQYAASSSGSALDAVCRALLKSRNMPEVHTIRHFHDDAGYIDALAQRIEQYWAEHGRGDHLLMSFHGVPRYTLDKGDPYHCECHKTGRLLAERLGLDKSAYTVAFQSRFGKAEWIKPYTAERLEHFGLAKTRRLDVVCPGFVADCLETLEEIAMEGKETFLEAGGGEYHYIPCLNDSEGWIEALDRLVSQHAAPWLPPIVPDLASRQQTLARAKALGATA